MAHYLATGVSYQPDVIAKNAGLWATGDAKHPLLFEFLKKMVKTRAQTLLEQQQRFDYDPDFLREIQAQFVKEKRAIVPRR